MADAQLLEVRHHGGGIAEAELARLELQAVGCRGMTAAIGNAPLDGVGNQCAPGEKIVHRGPQSPPKTANS